MRLAEPAQARALKGKKRQAKTDRLDAHWLAMLLAKEMLPVSWLPPEEIQRLRDLTRLREALRHDRTRGRNGYTRSSCMRAGPAHAASC